MDECKIPPPGWRCTRGSGHTGPCAAVPVPDDEALARLIKKREGFVYPDGEDILALLKELQSRRKAARAVTEAYDKSAEWRIATMSSELYRAIKELLP